MTEEERRIAESVQTACLRAALQAYERAGESGLCLEGRWEVAVDAIRALDVERLLQGLADAGSSAQPKS